VYHPPMLFARGPWRMAIPLLAAGSAVLVVVSPQVAAPIEVQTVPLNPGDRAQESVGRLRYRGGLWLSSADPRFGGLSDLRVDSGGAHFFSISDCGAVLEAGLVYDGRGFLTGLLNPRLEGLLGLGGGALRRDEVDAEGMARDGEGGFIVSFEGRHHLWRYPAPSGLYGVPVPFPAPAGIADCDPNAGIEAMTRLPDGRMLLISEGPDSGRPRATAGWIGRDPQWTSFSYPLVYDPGIPAEPFHPTAITHLPGTDAVLVLERRYPPVAVRIRRVEQAAFESGRGLAGVEVARWDPPLAIDNLEGIDAIVGSRGETLVYVISDDNNCAKTPGAPRHSRQRTLLLLFELTAPR
jgi:hypothetical protein